jgi:hypothetical protein
LKDCPVGEPEIEGRSELIVYFISFIYFSVIDSLRKISRSSEASSS